MAELALENVTYRYKGGDRNVVDSATCVFEGGRLNAVVGPSGSGKTTLLSLMAGLDEPTQGSISIDGEDVAGLDLDRYRRERVSMIFQAFQLFPAADRAGKCVLSHGTQRVLQEGGGRAGQGFPGVGWDR